MKLTTAMTGCDFDWMASNHAVWGWKATVKASVSGVSFLQLSPFFVSIFPLFPQKRLILRLILFNFTFLLVDFTEVLCSSANDLR